MPDAWPYLKARAMPLLCEPSVPKRRFVYQLQYQDEPHVLAFDRQHEFRLGMLTAIHQELRNVISALFTVQ